MQVFASTTFLGETTTDVEDVLYLMQDAAIDGVELGSTHNWRPDLKSRLAGHLNIPLLTHNYFPPAERNLVLNIASNDPDIRKASIDHMRLCLKFAGEIGALIYTIHPGFLADVRAQESDQKNRSFDFGFAETRTPYEQAFGLMTDALKNLCEEAELAGVTLAIETEGSLTSAGVTLMERPEEYTRLFEIIPRGVHVNINLAHSTLASERYGFDVQAFIRALEGRIVAAEISHNDGYRDQHRPLEEDAPVLSLINDLPDVPMILEFRLATIKDLEHSATILRRQTKQTKAAQAL